MSKGIPMPDLMSYVAHLSEEIGPRPATTDSEERAAEFVRGVFESRGLEAEVQSFDSPRTYAWAYVAYHLLTIGAALLSRISLPASLLLAGVTAIVLWLDLDTRWGLTSLLPKGPSQNVIARHVPRAGRNERVAKVIVVAHYDSARTSLAFSPSMVKNFAATFGLMKYCTYAVPVLIALRLLGARLPIEPWGWYVTLVPAAYLLIPLLINAHRELFMPFSPGANDNASGVAALLGVMERLVPEPDSGASFSREPVRVRSEQPAREQERVPEDSLLNYAPIAAPSAPSVSWSDEDEISWDTGVITGQTSLGLEASPNREGDAEAAAPVEPTREQSLRLFGRAYPGAEADEAPAPRPSRDQDILDFGSELDEDTAPLDMPASSSPSDERDHDAERRSLFGRKEKADQHGSEKHGLRDWLGLGGDFDARRKGREIGTWDNFDDEDDESGWKGGSAATDDPEDPAYTASVLARIRRKVTTNVDRDLVEKEVWFVATGAEEVGTVGMKAFLATYAHELQDATIINIDNIGSGAVAYVTREGMAKRYSADRRLIGATRRAVREADLPVKGREYHGLSTDATPALARGYRAMSVMAFDINGRLPNWHWTTDTTDNVTEDNIETAVELVTAIIREL